MAFAAIRPLLSQLLFSMIMMAIAVYCSLCTSDMVCCVAVMPFTAYYYLTGKDFAADSPVLCVLQPTLRYGNIGVSLLTIAMITINR